MEGKEKMFILAPVLLVLYLHTPNANTQTLDNIISEAANTTREFEFFYDLGQRDVRVELDMIFSNNEWNRIQALMKGGRTKRQAIKPGAGGYRWTNRVVPYEIAGGTFSSGQQSQIQAALNDWQRYTCLTFRRATHSDRNKIRFPERRRKRIIIHEVGHALGLHHEQTRPDRDNYVTIVSSNIAPNLLYNFQRYTWSTIENYRVPYDYYSIMHYGKTAFTINGGITIRTADSRYQNIIGNQGGLSFRDIKTMNLMYPCSKPAGCTKSNSDCPSAGFLGKDCQCWCPGSPYKICDGTETGGGGGGGGCQDQNRHCSSWAQRGECNRNPGYMHNYCKRSCNKCSGGGGGGGSSCRDVSRYCSAWARAGYCRHSYTVYMHSNCRRSCGICGSSSAPADCQDTDTTGFCDSWASMGECMANPGYMLVKCKRSCDACEASSDPVTSSSGSSSSSTCVDSNPRDCPYWAATNQCRLNPGWMLVNCKRSCNACSSASSYYYTYYYGGKKK